MLTDTLVIPSGADVTLTSNSKLADGSGVEFFSLYGTVDHERTIWVSANGVLNLDGVIVTHIVSKHGHGVHVSRGGELTMSNGAITNNIHGVWMTGGGSFSMSGGVITNNDGGVYVSEGVFSLSGGVIANNTAETGGGVYVSGTGSFKMTGGMVTNNTAHTGGGVYVGAGSFVMSGGVIANNSAAYGGGVYLQSVTFARGDMVYAGGGTVKLVGGTISGNAASLEGGGVCIDVNCFDGFFVGDGVIFENNCASKSYNRKSAYDEVYNSNIGSKVTWTAPFTQGYNNYDIGYADGLIVAGGYIEHTWVRTHHGIIIHIVIPIVVGIVGIVVLVFFLQKRKNRREKSTPHTRIKNSVQT